MTAKVVELLGGAGVALDFSEGYQALQKGVIEATLQSGSMVIMFKLNEVAEEHHAGLPDAGKHRRLDQHGCLQRDAR